MNLLTSILQNRWSKVVAFAALSIPLLLTLNDIRIELMFPGQAFGAEPNEALVEQLGVWSLRLLLVTLAISSLARLASMPTSIRFRRMAGLWSFAMIVLHLLSYFVLLADVDILLVIDDLTHRPYIIAGMIAVATLIPLAVTSTRGWQRRLGTKWKRLHTLVYVAALAAWIHLLIIEKGSTLDTFVYGSILLLLFAERIYSKIKKGATKQNRESAAS